MAREDVSGAGRWLLPAVAIGTTLAPLNSTMIAVALPEIQEAFDVSVTATAWLVTLYLVAMAVGQPIGGRLGDLYGRRRVYLLGLIGFGVASLGCAFAPSLPILILFRLLQALSGALSFPNGTAMVREAVPPERRGAAFGAVGLAAGIAAASGPPIGGVLVHAFGWSAIFWANVPVVAVALGLCWGSLPRRTVVREAGIRFDLARLGVVRGLARRVHRHPDAAQGGAAGHRGIGRRDRGRDRGWVRPLGTADGRAGGRCAPVYAVALRGGLRLDRPEQPGDVHDAPGLAALPGAGARAQHPGGRGHPGRALRLLRDLGPARRPLDRSDRPVVAGGGRGGGAAGRAALSSRSLPARRRCVPIAVALALMGVGIGVSGAPVQMAAVESVSHARTGSAAGIYSTARYMGSVVGSSVLAIIFTKRPGEGEDGRFIALFAGLAVVALIGIGANARIARRRAEPRSTTPAGVGGEPIGGQPRTAR